MSRDIMMRDWRYPRNETNGRKNMSLKCNCVMMVDWIYPQKGEDNGQNMSSEYNKYNDRWLNEPLVYQYKYDELYGVSLIWFLWLQRSGYNVGDWVNPWIRNVSDYTCLRHESKMSITTKLKLTRIRKDNRQNMFTKYHTYKGRWVDEAQIYCTSMMNYIVIWIAWIHGFEEVKIMMGLSKSLSWKSRRTWVYGNVSKNDFKMGIWRLSEYIFELEWQ